MNNPPQFPMYRPGQAEAALLQPSKSVAGISFQERQFFLQPFYPPVINNSAGADPRSI
jgi:hypothetical protein